MNDNQSLPPFDELLRMHQEDPAALEQLRQRLLLQAIDAAPSEQRAALQELVGKMNDVRAAATSDWEAASAAFRMMQQSVRNLGDALHEARHRVADLQTTLLLKRISMAAAGTAINAAGKPPYRIERRKARRM